MPDSLVFFTVANASYEPFVLPYLASVLHHNPGAGVEVRMERPEKFGAENRPALTLLDQHFPQRFSLTKFPQANRLPQKSAAWQEFPGGAHSHLARFLETPERKAEFVYIGDIDILILEEVAPAHLAHMRRTGLPYSNMRRSNQPRLTGLHFTRWDAYYPQVELDDTAPAKGDERLLYWLVEQKGFGLPDPADEFRPTHGYHLSIARNTASSNAREDPGWGDFNSSELLARYLTFTTTTLWQELAPLLDHRYRQLLSMLDIVLAYRFPEETWNRQPAPGTLPRDWW